MEFYFREETILSTLFKSVTFSLVSILILLAGYLIYKTGKTPFDIVLGIPLILIGGGLTVNKLWDSFLAIFSPTYNKGICILCSR